MNKRQLTIIIVEVILILLGGIFYFMGDRFFQKKQDLSNEVLKEKIVAINSKITLYEKKDPTQKFTPNFLRIRKEYNDLNLLFVDKKYPEALEKYTILLGKVEEINTKIENYYAKLKTDEEKKVLEKKLLAEKKKTAAAQAKKIKTSYPKPAPKTVLSSYTPLKKVSSTPTQPKPEPVKEITTATTSTPLPVDTKGKIDINNASFEELQKLPRIGPVKSKSIIDYRNSHNGFKNVADLENVSGIGPKTMASLRPLIYCGNYGGTTSNTSDTSAAITNVKEKININTASQTELETIPKIGPKTAQNIINYRNEFGSFKSYEDILNVPRIGEKTLEAIKPYITLGEEK